MDQKKATVTKKALQFYKSPSLTISRPQFAIHKTKAILIIHATFCS